MRRFAIFRITVYSLIAGFAMAGGAGGQTAAADDTDIQSWNDVQLTVPMSKKVDFTTTATVRVGQDVSRAVDNRFLIGFVFKPTKRLSITPFYWYIDARNSRGLFRLENELNLRGVYRFPTKSFGLSHRSQYEYRMRTTGNSWRYRAQLTVEKELPEHWVKGMKVFASDEVFYDSVTGKFSRNRFAAGISKQLSKQLSVDVYYMQQNDGFSHPGDLYTLWTAWKIKM